MLWCWWNSICWNFILEESRQKQRILLLISLYLCIYRFLSANFEVSLALTQLHRCWWRMFRRKSPVDFYTNFIIFKLSLPHECALRDSHAVGLIEPNAGLLMFCAFCYGWLDGTLNTQLIALIGSISSPNVKEYLKILVLTIGFRSDLSRRKRFSRCLCCMESIAMRCLLCWAHLFWVYDAPVSNIYRCCILNPVTCNIFKARFDCFATKYCPE